MVHIALAVALRAPLVPLYKLFAPRLSCVWSEPGHKPDRFASTNAISPDGQFIVQRNFESGFSEVIVYSYSQQHHQYVRTQITNAGDYYVATSPGLVNGTWTFTNVPMKAMPHVPAIILRLNSQGQWIYQERGIPGTGTCTKT